MNEYEHRRMLAQDLVRVFAVLLNLREYGWSVPDEMMWCCGTCTEQTLSSLGNHGALLADEQHIAAHGIALMTHRLDRLPADDFQQLIVTLRDHGLHIHTSTTWRGDYYLHQLRHIDHLHIDDIIDHLTGATS